MRRAFLLLGIAALSAAGCYTLRPVVGGGAPEAGAKVALYVNDAGRAVLSQSVGTEIERIEGRLTNSTPAEYTLAVTHVYFLRGGVQIWNGETLRIERDNVVSVSERRISRGRSVALGVAGAGSVAFMLSRGLLGAGLGDPPDIPSDTGAQLRVIWP